MNLPHQGRKAVVTGGASGIGEAIVQRLLAGGAQVSVWDRNPAALEAARAQVGASGQTVAVDVADEKSVKAALATTLAQFGAIDILVNSAGITGPNSTVIDYPADAWDQVIAVNLRGTFLTCKYIAAEMKARGYGRIVNIASVAGKEGNPNASAYSASKGAVIALTKSLGKELATNGVCVNCVTPAAVRTPLFDQMTDAHIAFMLSKIPMQRFGRVEEIAALVGWLASEECSFSTGSVFDISGGRSTY